MFVESGSRMDNVPASKVKVGDKVVLDGASTGIVTGIRPVVRQGMYTPLTTSGRLLVNGVLSSCYVALQRDSIRLEVGSFSIPFTILVVFLLVEFNWFLPPRYS